MVSFDKHSRCARCRDKGHGEDPCVKNLAYKFRDLLTPDQLLQLSTTTYKICKEKQKSKEVLVDPSTVTVVSQADQEGTDRPSANSSVEFALPAPSFRKELQDLDEKWSVRMARLEALLTMGQCPPSQQPSFSPVKVPVTHQAPAGALYQTPFMQSSVPSGQADPASGPDGTQTAAESSRNMSSPLENLYPETDSEPVFQQPRPVSSAVSSSGPLHFPAREFLSPDQVEEGEVSELELDDHQDSDSGEKDKVLIEDQNYHETVRGVRAFMGWTHIPDLEYSPTSRADNPWIGHRSQPVGKISILLPPEDWFCKKLENMNLVLIEGYPSKSSEPGGLHMDQFIRPSKSQSPVYELTYETTWPAGPLTFHFSWPV